MPFVPKQIGSRVRWTWNVDANGRPAAQKDCHRVRHSYVESSSAVGLRYPASNQCIVIHGIDVGSIHAGTGQYSDELQATLPDR